MTDNGSVYRNYLDVHSDDRGNVRETYRASWHKNVPPILQLVRSESRPGVLRAMHAHKKQWDIWQVLEGKMEVALYDHTNGFRDTIPLTNRETLYIPPGISHGFYTKDGCLLQYGLTREYDGTDEFEWAAYDFPDWTEVWPSSEWVVRSERDRNAPTLEAFIKSW